MFFMDVPHSDAPFMKAYPGETTEAFPDGHVSAFAFFGGVPLSILYDNTKWRWRGFAATASGSGLAPSTSWSAIVCSEIGSAGQGLVEDGRRRFLTPVPTAESFEELNARLEAACLADLDRKASGRSETIGSRVARQSG